MTTKTTKQIKPNLAHVQTALAGGSEILGALVYWRRLDGVRIQRAKFRAGFESIGLGKAVSKDPKPEACLNQAAAMASRKQGSDGNAVRIEMKGKSPTTADYAVLVRRDEADGRRRYIEEALCSVQRGVRTPPPPLTTVLDAAAVAQDDVRDAVIADLDARYQELLNYALTLELSDALIAALGLMEALPLRTGVYFVPQANLDQARALKAFIEGETDVQLTIWTIARSDENASEAKRDARNAFTDRFKALVGEVEGFMAELPKGEEPPTKSINARARHFRELEGQVQLYGEILGDYRDELEAKIAAAKQALLGAYLGAESEEEAA